MAFSISSGREDPTIEYDVTDAASGAPMRVTIATGVLALTFDHGGIRVIAGTDRHQQPMGFFVLGVPPLQPGYEPLVVPEMFLSQVGVQAHTTSMHGVSDVRAQVAPDPQRGGMRGVYVTFMTCGSDAMVLRYRVTIYRPR